MHLPQQQRISLTLVTGLAALVAALAAAAMAATPGYTMPAEAGGQVPAARSSLTDVRAPDRQAPAPGRRSGRRSPTSVPPTARRRPPSRRRSPSAGSASTTDALGPEDGVPATKAPVVQAGQPTWPETPASLPAPVTVSADSDGFELGSAAVGAAGVLMLGLLGLVAYAAVLRRRPVTAGH